MNILRLTTAVVLAISVIGLSGGTANAAVTKYEASAMISAYLKEKGVKRLKAGWAVMEANRWRVPVRTRTGYQVANYYVDRETGAVKVPSNEWFIEVK